VQCMKNPIPIGVGYLAQYLVKPFLGFMIAKVCKHAVILCLVT
jgi:BASS family bile acid:Na+ symporter